MIKWLLLALLIWLVLGGLRRRSQPPGADRPPPAEMVRCAHCGLHLPGSEVLTDAQGQPYCCPEHRDAAGRPRR